MSIDISSTYPDEGDRNEAEDERSEHEREAAVLRENEAPEDEMNEGEVENESAEDQRDMDSGEWFKMPQNNGGVKFLKLIMG